MMRAGMGLGITDTATRGVHAAPSVFSASGAAADVQCWFHEPRAVAHGGKLWVGSNGSDNNTTTTGRATLYEITEATGAVLREDLATGVDWGDDHNYPVVARRSDGRLVVFYCAHRLVAPIRYRVSVSPDTMADGWSQEYTIDVSATRPTYPSPVRLSGESGKFYLFFRNGVDATMSLITSADLDTVAPASVDGGALGSTPTWSAESQIAQSSGTQGVYAKVHSNGVDRIDVLITDAAADTSGPKNDVRHGYWSAGAWHASDGTSIGDGSTLIPFTDFTAVATSGAPDNFGDVWAWHVQRRANGVIEGVFARFISVSEHRYYYARWDGSAWSKTEIDAGYGMGVPDTRSSQVTDGGGASEGYYSPGVYLDTIEEGVVYVSIGDSAYSLLYRYITADHGATWSRVRVSGMVKENIRPCVPQGRSANYAVIYASGEYHFYDFNTNPAATNMGYTTKLVAASRGYNQAPAAPANTALPIISGTAQTGNELTASAGTWTGDLPMTFAYQWRRDGVAISGATNQAYTIVLADVGKAITVECTATNYQGSQSAVSAAASAVPVNLVAKSEQKDQWTLSAVTVTANVAANPVNAATTADRVTEQTATTSHSSSSANISFASGTQYTYSEHVKFETRQFLQLLFGSGAFGTQAYANFDVQNGTVQTVGSSASAAIVSLGGGWYRISVTATATATAASPVGLFGIQAGNSARAQSYAGVATNTWLAFGAQVETGPVANTYVQTA